MIAPDVPSPIGHALAGLAAAWAVDLVPGDRAWRTAPASASWSQRAGDGLTAACVVLGAAADIDLLFVTHRTVTHSVGAVILVALFAATLAANAHRPVLRVASMCAAAYATRVLKGAVGCAHCRGSLNVNGASVPSRQGRVSVRVIAPYAGCSAPARDSAGTSSHRCSAHDLSPSSASCTPFAPS